MSTRVAKQNEEKYKTTYSKSYSYEIEDGYISVSYIDLIVDLVKNRLKMSRDEISISLQSGDYYIDIQPTSLETVFADVEKNRRNVHSIQINSGIQHAFGASDDDHASLTITINLDKKSSYHPKTSINTRIYAVSTLRISSQDIIDWGNGVTQSLKELSRLRKEVRDGELVIDERNMTIVKKVSNNDGSIPVHITNKVSLNDAGFRELKQPKVYIPIILTIIGSILAVVFWLIPMGQK